MKKIIGISVIFLGLAICVIFGGLLMVGLVAGGASEVIITQSVLREHNIPMSADLIFNKKEDNPKGGNLNEIPMFINKNDFRWDEVGLNFVDILQADDYTIFQFLFKQPTEQLSNPKASTIEGIREKVVDFYLDDLLKNGWVLVLLPGYDFSGGQNYAYLTGNGLPLLFQQVNNPSQFLIIDSKQDIGRAIRNKDEVISVYWLVLYTNPKISKPLPALTTTHGQKYVGTVHETLGATIEGYLELLENNVFIMQVPHIGKPKIYVGKYSIDNEIITLVSPEMVKPIKGDIVGNKITFKSDGLDGFTGELIRTSTTTIESTVTTTRSSQVKPSDIVATVSQTKLAEFTPTAIQIIPTSTPATPTITPTPDEPQFERVWSIQTGKLRHLGVAEDGTIYGLITEDAHTYVVISPQGEVLKTVELDDDLYSEFWKVCYRYYEFFVMPNGTVTCLGEVDHENSSRRAILSLSPELQYKKTLVGNSFAQDNKRTIPLDVTDSEGEYPEPNWRHMGDGSLIYLQTRNDYDKVYLYRYDGYGNLLNKVAVEWSYSEDDLYWQETTFGGFILYNRQTKAWRVYNRDFKLVYEGIPDGLTEVKDSNQINWSVSFWDDLHVNYPLYDQLGNVIKRKYIKIDSTGQLSEESTEFDEPDLFYSYPHQLAASWGDENYLLFYRPDNQLVKAYQPDHNFNSFFEATFIGFDGNLYSWTQGKLIKYLLDLPTYPVQLTPHESTGSVTLEEAESNDTTTTPHPIPTLPGQNCAHKPVSPFTSIWENYSPLLGCVLSSLNTIPTIAEESFQGGHMLWRSDTNQVYALYDRNKADGSQIWQNGEWATSPDWNWQQAGEPDPDGIGLTPPSGLIEPKRGFGYVWRTFLGRENGKLGWALDREYGFDKVGQVQEFERGLILKGSSERVYILIYRGNELYVH